MNLLYFEKKNQNFSKEYVNSIFFKVKNAGRFLKNKWEDKFIYLLS